MAQPCALVWFRDDLRVSDNPALAAAVASGLPLLCVFILDEGGGGLRPPGGASLWRLDRALMALDGELARRGGALHVLRGPAEEVLPRVADAASASRIFWNRRYGGAEIAQDTRLKQAFREQGRKVFSFNGALLVEPWNVASRTGGAFKVFTPFWRALRAQLEPRPPLPAPDQLCAAAWPAEAPRPLAHEHLRLAPQKPNWAKDFREPDAGEAGAQRRLRDFLSDSLDSYGTNRDRLDLEATSRLSAHLNFGEISPRQICAAVSAPARGADKFLSELGWREFSYHLLYASPDLSWRNFNARFDAFPYAHGAAAEKDLAAWRQGRTGYPVVDAAMRELWTTGNMHNRARMVVASFLTKHLLIDWREGEKWFWDTLPDADEASNAASWQWVAGCGADAAPFFRIFNPVLQGEKFDPEGAYVRRFCPELARLPAPYIHKPWAAPPAALAKAGVKLGETYPAPIVDHDFARRRALAALASLKA
jgi:deoxyribodipyrimidine photo-lyase